MNLSEISDLLAWGAATAYTVAMIAFAMDLSKMSDAIGQRKAEELARVPVGAGAPVRAAASAAFPADPEGGRRRSKSLGVAMSTLWLGFIIHAVAVVTRGVAAGHVPWANMYEFWLTGTFLAIGIFLLLQLKLDVRFLGVVITFVAVTFLVLALNVFHVVADEVQPALRNYWLVIHVGVAVSATAVFTVAFATSVLQLLRDSRDNGSTLLHGEGAVIRGRNVAAGKFFNWRFLDAIPTPTALEALSFRLNGLGFVLWTFTIIGGAIWADGAWGRPWGWDPKEVWSFIVWVVYAAYLHARTTRGWSGRRAAYFVVVGYACVLFNFTGVNILFSGLHSYSGVQNAPNAK
ncbi:cytochrome c-type biogenesis protein CcsB [Sanguibacter gelidistatuariae]|uniref:Cytochrome c-type biogenesis protein CcsB n=1 Tax=Sanguibacter gelidistatuariae TaxID=1814289 RepID=A0A1G6X308_9MICO|nr:c-type cytochrome biogenesis protein CcsB [Sanguibacter gelidistatuariae]SDD72459.1 cytochrome c-type biogenesis protein CcsB [Sanguibacter gelidistatuariae]